MATRYEQFVEQQRQRAAQVRESAMNGTLRAPAAASQTSRSDAFRANSGRAAAEDKARTKTVLQDTLAGVMGPPTVSQPAVNPNARYAKLPKLIENRSKPFESNASPFADKLPLPSALMPANGGPTRVMTEYDKREQYYDDLEIPEAFKYPARVMNKLAFGNPAGRFISNSLAGNSGVTQRDSTGSKVADKVSDVINDFVTPFLTPTGAPVGMGPNVGSYDVAGKALTSRPGQAAVDKIAQGINKIAPKLNPTAAQNIARVGATETLAGPIQNVGIGLLNGQDSNEEVGMNALIGTAGGAVLGFGGAALGQGVKALRNRPVSGQSNVGAPDSVPAAAAVPERVVGPSIETQTPELPPVRSRTEPVKFDEMEPVMSVREQEINAKPLAEWTQDDIDYLMEASKGRELPVPERPAAPEPAPLQMGEPILRPGQFDEPAGLGIAAGQRVKPYDSISNETRSQLVTRQQRDPLSLNGTSDRAYTALVDDLHPLNQQDKVLENLMEEPLKASERIHTLGLASRGADVISKRIITDGLVDSNGQVVGESLKNILKPLNGLMKKNKHIYVDFEDYLLNKHAVTRAERGEKVFRDELGWTPEYGAQKAAEYEQRFPEFAEAANKFYTFNRQMVQSWLVDTGIITQDTAQAWLDANPFYVPNKRQFTQLEKGNGGYGQGKKGFGNQGNPVKGYQKGGSQRKIISPIEATIENVDAYVKAAKRNQVMQQYVRNIKQSPEDFKGWAEIVKQPEKPADIKKLMLTDDMEVDGIDNLLSRFSDDFDVAMQRTKLDKDNIVRVMMDGEPVHVLIKDKQLLSAITALGPESAGWMLNLVGKLTNNMKLLTTGSNPVFSLTRNLFRDIPQAYVASTTRDNPIGFISELVSAAVDIAGKRGAYKQFLNAGGGHASSIAADRNLLSQSKRAALPQGGARKTLLKTKDAYENFLNAVEIAPRLAEFKRSLDLTSDLQAALAAAQDITVNFKRRGALSREIDKVFPYFNAAAQGLDKTIRTYKDNPAKAIVKSVLAVTVPTLALYAINRDDPAYQKLSSRQKDAFLMIPKGDGTFFKVAKPQEQGTIFSDIPERLMRYFADEDPAAFRDFADRLRTTFTPPGIQGALKQGGITDKLLGAAGDTIFGPVADLAANKTFSGAPIVPGYLDNLSPELQYDAKTTNVAKSLGELTGSSPKQLDYLARQYTGFLGQFGQPLLSPGGDVGSALTQQVTADPVFSNDLSTEFYRLKGKLDQANTDKDQKELPDWYSNGLRKQMDKISKRMSLIREQQRDVQNDKGLSNKAKREELRKLQQSINDMAERGNELARDTVPY